MHRWCIHGPINFYYSFWWSNFILCLYNIDTLNICMKESGSENIIWQLWDNCLYGLINSYHSFWWSNLKLCQYNEYTLNICMKEFIIFVIPPANFVCGGYTVFVLSVCASVRPCYWYGFGGLFSRLEIDKGPFLNKGPWPSVSCIKWIRGPQGR